REPDGKPVEYESQHNRECQLDGDRGAARDIGPEQTYERAYQHRADGSPCNRIESIAIADASHYDAKICRSASTDLGDRGVDATVLLGCEWASHFFTFHFSLSPTS